jgi:hypothetical protein
MTNKRLIKGISLIIFLICLITGLYFLNLQLKAERLFIYAKGSDQKAVLNSTWQMSIREVERANDCKLTEDAVPSPDEVLCGLKYIIDHKRFVSKKGCDLNIWGNDREVIYDFFDDQLFNIRILDNVFNKQEEDSIIVSNLKEKFGNFNKSKDDNFGGTFSTTYVNVAYQQFNYTSADANKTVDRLIITLTYKPLYEQIKATSENEQKNIF